MSADISAHMSAGTSADISSDISANTYADIFADISAHVPADTSAHMSADISADLFCTHAPSGGPLYVFLKCQIAIYTYIHMCKQWQCAIWMHI